MQFDAFKLLIEYHQEILYSSKNEDRWNGLNEFLRERNVSHNSRKEIPCGTTYNDWRIWTKPVKINFNLVELKTFDIQWIAKVESEKPTIDVLVCLLDQLKSKVNRILTQLEQVSKEIPKCLTISNDVWREANLL